MNDPGDESEGGSGGGAAGRQGAAQVAPAPLSRSPGLSSGEVRRPILPGEPSSDDPSGVIPRLSANAEARALLEALPDGAFVAEGQRIVAANSSLVELLGYSSVEELARTSPLSFLAAHAVRESRALITDLLAACLRGQQSHASESLWLHTREQRRLYAHVSFGSISFDGRQATLVCIRDFTKSHEAGQRLGYTDRMASIGSMAAGVAHEINNPLAYIATNVAYALERMRYLGDLLEGTGPVKVDSPRSLLGVLAPISQALSEAQQGTEQVARLLRDLRSLTQDDSEFVSVDLAKAIASAVHMARSEYRYRATVSSELGVLGFVLGNETRLVQLFLNLVANAAQAFDDDRPDRNRIWIRATLTDDHVLVEVRDNGRGISEDVMQRVFDPFFTTRPKGQGTGLGLTIARNLAASMNGSLTLESAPSSGTTARVRLKRAHEQQVSRPTPVPSVVPLRRARVLIIDNEPLIVRAVGRLLSGDHDIDSASNGLEGLARLKYEGPFDVVVCDLMMPEMNGMELYRKVQEDLPLLANRFVFLTGGAFTDQAARFLREVDCPTLDKPIDPALLRAVVGGVVAREG